MELRVNSSTSGEMVIKIILLLKTALCFINIPLSYLKASVYKMEKNNSQIFTVSNLTRKIKTLLEEKFSFVWVTGEISNFVTPASGHSYFSLKDSTSVINCVLFKNQKSHIKFSLENGMNVFGLARLSLYEPRGSYQLIFEHIEPEGTGSLQLAFEQLKNKLAAQGYFEDKYKKDLPYLPGCVSVITSKTGAVIKDIINVATRRFPNCEINIIPVKVQGDDSVEQICNAIEWVNELENSDVIILARGGGSLEDLESFNNEKVADAIFSSAIPIVSAIGHETDFTISDFVADLRAPTPSAAAEIVFPDKVSLVLTVKTLQDRLQSILKEKIKSQKAYIDQYVSRLKSPQSMIDDSQFKIEDLVDRLTIMIKRNFKYHISQYNLASDRLVKLNPVYHIPTHINATSDLHQRLDRAFKHKIDKFRQIHNELNLKLEAVNPNTILDRGYSITRFHDSKVVITNAVDVNKKDKIEIILNKGRLITQVEKTQNA